MGEMIDDSRTNPALFLWMRHHGGIDPYAKLGFDSADSEERVAMMMEATRARDKAIGRWAYAVPNAPAVAAIAKLSPIVEIGAGTGYWARLLVRAGASVIAYDNRSNIRYTELRRFGRFYPVLDGDATAVAFHPDCTLFLCWPPYDEPLAFDAVSRWGGKWLAYIGEGSGGCTASDAFHNYVNEHFEHRRRIDLPQWWGIHDRLNIYERKG